MSLSGMELIKSSCEAVFNHLLLRFSLCLRQGQRGQGYFWFMIHGCFTHELLTISRNLMLTLLNVNSAFIANFISFSTPMLRLSYAYATPMLQG